MGQLIEFSEAVARLDTEAEQADQRAHLALIASGYFTCRDCEQDEQVAA